MREIPRSAELMGVFQQPKFDEVQAPKGSSIYAKDKSFES
jgi:hypothetical protein